MSNALTLEQAQAGLIAHRKKHGRSKIHVRKAYAALGDDVTLSRFVKVKQIEQKGHRKPRQMGLGDLRHPAFEEARSFFNDKGVKDVNEVDNVLVSGHSNVKIGRDVRKGRLFRGYWIYTLTLEERATCPRTCHHWTTCYGNNMPFAKRIRHGKALTSRLQREIPQRLGVRGRAGLLVRLHALGDFYSVEYVKFWARMLRTHKNLAVFGYTARTPDDAIGNEIHLLKQRFGRRFAIRWSNGRDLDAAIPIFKEDDCPDETIVCPEQTGRTQCCATCGLCWNTDKPVAFLEH